jgi:hypothetical protein
MEEKRSPIQLYNLFKSFVFMFMIQAVLVLIMPSGLVAPIWYQIFAVNLIVAGVLGWYLYKQWYHIVFSFDDAGFTLKKGKNPPVALRWSGFSRVSLVRNEYNEFKVKLYNNGDAVEIPASKLKLEPSKFRLQVIDLVTKASSPRS